VKYFGGFMWVRKEPSEIIKLYVMKFLKIMIICIVIIVPALYFADIVSYHRHGLRALTLLDPVFLVKIPFYVIIAFFASVIFFIIKIKRPKTVMCEQCYKISDYSKNKRCICGGININIECMKSMDSTSALFSK
jgi:hypothetical protein